jgi:hypothetical protein
MKGGRFSERADHRDSEALRGQKIADLAREYGVSEATTIYTWKAKYGGMEVSEAHSLSSIDMPLCRVDGQSAIRGYGQSGEPEVSGIPIHGLPSVRVAAIMELAHTPRLPSC